MEKLCLNGQWILEPAKGGEALPCTIPGSVASALLEHGRMPDPYWRGNEKAVLPVFEKDYRFRRTFSVDPDAMFYRHIELRCDGLDTLAELTLNGVPVGTADNMHRTWRFDVKGVLQPGENTLEILFHSAAAYLKAHPSRIGKPHSVIRKAACMFGWDWGLDLPDMGIWRDISIEMYNEGRLEGVIFHQEHLTDLVKLTVEPVCAQAAPDLQTRITLRSPDGTFLEQKTVNADVSCVFAVQSPQLWWPTGYGGQPLYTVETELLAGERVCDYRVQRIGLRTIVLDRTEVDGGSRYAFTVNDVPVFFRGENLIIEDAVLSRVTEDRWKRLIDNCLKSNLNGIRVWGGAVFPPELFYDLCDEAGLMVYQDMMFACSFYAVSEPFLQNVRGELNDNLARISHHVCIALLCGSNEIDATFTVGCSTDPETAELRRLFGAGKDPLPEPVRQLLWAQYTPLFLRLIPEAARRWAPDTGYVPSSPSVRIPGGAKSFFDYLSDGDMHYYLQYNGNAPYQKMRDFRCRFMTEMGFQSYPSMKTICDFTEPEDRMPYTPVMYAHQKCANGNETIELYMERDYCVPKDFSDYVYLSQLQAGEIMRYSVEHFRRDNGYCRGVILWQLNDCWPVVSWSGIDYYGRWKALQYYIKRFYAPVLLSACEEGDKATLWLSNETREDCAGTVGWRLLTTDGTVLDEGSREFTVAAGQSCPSVRLDYTGILEDTNRNGTYLHFWFETEQTKTEGTVLFVLPKAFAFRMPHIRTAITESEREYRISLETDCFAKAVALDTTEGDCVFSDNYVDLVPGECRIITARKEDCSGIRDAQALRSALRVNTLNGVLLRASEGEGAV
ncbi:MAG: glycosyl hydrolase 2 galactose-binding domain-containing protein [Candidatus Limivicinus sp.]